MHPRMYTMDKYGNLNEETGRVMMENWSKHGVSDDAHKSVVDALQNGKNTDLIHGAFQEEAANGKSSNPRDVEYMNAITKNEGVVQKIVEGKEAKDIKDHKLQDGAAKNITDILENGNNDQLYKDWANQVSDLYKENQLAIHEKLTNSKHDGIAETAAGNIHKYDKSVQTDALKATYNSGNDKAIQVAASNISKMDVSVQAEAIKVTFATNNIQAIEIVLLQVNKIDSAALASVKTEFDAQVAIMEEKHVQSIINAFAKRQVNKEFGMKVDNDSQQFKTRLEKYIEELKGLPTSEIYRRLCDDVMFWPTDMQSAMLERASKYCPQLFNMMLEK